MAERAAPQQGARLAVGGLSLLEGAPFSLDAGGFDRHTFLCGQSGSGKSYSLGLILEQLLLETDLRMVILDPNSDFARLREVRDATEPDLAERWAELAAGIAIVSARRDGTRAPAAAVRRAHPGGAGGAAAAGPGRRPRGVRRARRAPGRSAAREPLRARDARPPRGAPPRTPRREPRRRALEGLGPPGRRLRARQRSTTPTCAA